MPLCNAIAGIDLADAKQMVVGTDHESRVLARRVFQRRAWQLGAALDWAAVRARAARFDGVTVAVAPTGHRWRVVGQLAGDRAMPFVCAIGAASVLAETGDPARFTTGRALVKHSGLAPRQKTSGTYTGRTRTTGQGRPWLRLAAWRAVWGALRTAR